MSNDMDEESLVKSICAVSRLRARELLEAASGDVERAVDIHFQQRNDDAIVIVEDDDDEHEKGNDSGTAHTPMKPSSRKRSLPTQQTLDHFVGKTHPKISKQQELDLWVKRNDSNQSKTIKTCATEEELVGTSAQSGEEVFSLSSKAASKSGPLHNFQVAESSKVEKQSISLVKHSSIETNDELPYKYLADTFATIASTSKRTIKLQCLQDLFQTVISRSGGIGSENPDLLIKTIELTLGELHFSSHPQPLQVSGGLVSTAVRTVFGVSRTQLRKLYRKLGDLGDVAASLFRGQTSVQSFFGAVSKPISMQQVHHLFKSIATVSTGKGSQSRRQQLVTQLLKKCREGNEICFVVRTLLGNMRLGATIKTVLAGLARAVHTGEASTSAKAIQRLQTVFAVCPRVPDIATAVLRGGIDHAEQNCTISVGHPVEPMLAKSAHSFEEVAQFLSAGSAVAEWKYDGVRCQGHWDGKVVKLFSRHLRECTNQYPAAVQYTLEACKSGVQNFILDGEIVGVRSTEQGGLILLPFQELSTGSKDASNEQNVRVFCFDLMYINGRSLVSEPLFERQRLLRECFCETNGFAYAQSESLPTYNELLLSGSLEKAVQDGAEGLMIKLTGATIDGGGKIPPGIGYQAGTRNATWLKLKRDYVAGDTIDVVPIGAWYGNGRKAQNGFLSPVLLAIHDDGIFYSISRCMSFTDEMYRATRDFFCNGTPFPSEANLSSSNANKEDYDQDNVNDEEFGQSDGDSSPFLEPSANECQDEGDVDNHSLVTMINCSEKKPSIYVTNENPAIWFQPLEVWEVSFADLTLSPVHTAALGLCDEDRGVALRFPRFLRRRPDKSVEQATTPLEVAQLYASQTKVWR